MGEFRRPRLGRHTIAGLFAILLWSTTVAVARSLAEPLGSLRAGASVYVLAGSLCLVVLAAKRGAARDILRLPRRFLFVCGALFVFYMVACFVAIGMATDRQQVLEIALINYLWCPLTLLLSIPVLGKKARPLIVPGTALVVIGLFLVLTPEASVSWSTWVSNIAGNPAAYGLALAVAVAWAVYSNLTRRLAGSEDASGVLLFLPVTGAAFLVLSLANPSDGAWTTQAVLEFTYLGASTAAGYFLWDIAMRKGDVVFVAACSYFIPLFATLISCWYLEESIGTYVGIGCALIVLGSLVSWISVREPARR